jgi:hypothetical protein
MGNFPIRGGLREMDFKRLANRRVRAERGTARDNSKYQLVVRFTQKKVDVVAIP